MIIKGIDINSFGRINDYHLKFTEGINLIYGENEAGKSTLQNFIKIWLYGFSNYHGKNLLHNERIKYTPLSGERIKGTLTFEIDKREYMIIRSFGKTKKDDEIKIIDSLSGEDLSDIYGDVPGEKILGVNRSTFIKTLFIGQLAVEIKSDKDEKIIDKIVNFTGNDEDELNIQKSFKKINQYINSITNSRKNGSLDIARENRGALELEKIEYYKVHENTLAEEESLMKLKNRINTLKENYNNLLIYKKHLKTEELKNKYNLFKNKEREFRLYRDKINQLQKEISNLEYKKEQFKNTLNNSYILENIDENLSELFTQYKCKLNEIKNIYSDVHSLSYRKKYIMIFILLFNLLIITNFKYKIFIIITDICITLTYLYHRFFNKKSSEYKFRHISQEIRIIEKKLDNLQQRLGAKDYEDLFNRINYSFKSKNYYNDIEEKINKKNSEIQLLQSKLQMIESFKNTEEKLYLEKKITEINSNDINSWDENIINTINITVNSKSHFKNLTILEKEEIIEREINKYNDEIMYFEKEIIKLKNSIQTSFYGKRNLAEIEEDILNLDLKIDNLKKSLKAGELARETMKKAYLEIRDDFGPQLNYKLLKKYKEISNKDYDSILVSDEYDINLLKDNSILDYKLLSNGSKDQLFLALRLSFIEMIFSKKDFPLFLDDVFVQYDDKKLKNTLLFLSKEHYKQQLIFTCHNREKIFFEELNIKFNYFELN